MQLSAKRPKSADFSTFTAIRSGRRAGEYTHINQDMLKDGGFFDMPIQVVGRLAMLSQYSARLLLSFLLSFLL
jgi:hypothetical protein